ncbi:MAG: tetraacyldisaccharide 4'-kinase [Tannerella sp.]|nr:tetraacyldisaccharide 4'-kinase [Tannerella sp.]
MNRRNPVIKSILTPFALLYYVIVWFRNTLFEWGILPSERFPLPVICVGNITAGGTGKTPFTEYLIEILKQNYRVATLSRGYKRETKGFLIVNEQHTPIEAGDEACQIKQKFPNVIVAVDENRRRGIKKMLAMIENERPDVVILDDAMQHRYVSPSLTIMLTEHSNIYYEDSLLPAGNLREPHYEVYRSDIIVVTKCTSVLKPIERRLIEKNMMLMANQHLYFSTLKYHRMEALFPDKALHPCHLSEISENEDLLLIAGIANPHPFIEKVKNYSNKITEFIFPDHYSFGQPDIQSIDVIFQKMPSNNRRIICTEKDAMRLKSIDYLPESWKSCMYFLPIKIDFLYDKENDFKGRIIDHVCSTINIVNKNVKN